MVGALRCGGPAAVAFALLPLRTVLSHATVAVVIVAAMALTGMAGRRLASVIGAAGGALAFALLWAPPVGSLRVEHPTDRVTGVMILVVGVLLAELARRPHPLERSRPWPAEDVRRRRSRWPWRPAGARRLPPIESLRSVGRVAHEVAEGDDAEFILLDVARTLVELLDLSDCRYEAAPLDATCRPILVHDGDLELRGLCWSPMQLGLPDHGFDIILAARGQTLGRFVCTPRQPHTIAEDRVLAALALVDQAASAHLIGAVS